MRKGLSQQKPQGRHGGVVHNIYEAGETSLDLSDLDQHVTQDEEMKDHSCNCLLMRCWVANKLRALYMHTKHSTNLVVW